MKVIILAAGMGTRLGKYTKDLPKGMLSFNGKALIEWQIQQLRKIGINDINIVTGYKKEMIDFPGITYFDNTEYATTNMIESLLCALPALNSEVIITYSDVIFTAALAKQVAEYKGDIGVAVDSNWKEYWMMRYGTTENDLESLNISDGRITDLGKEIHSSSGLDYRYIGMIKFSEKGIRKAIEIYNRKKQLQESWIQSGKQFRQGYMTDLLNELILNNSDVEPIISEGGWLEFDTNEDYEVMNKLLNENKIDSNFF